MDYYRRNEKITKREVKEWKLTVTTAKELLLRQRLECY